MQPDTNRLARRDVLKAAGGAAAAVGVTGLASANPSDVVRVNVGFKANSGRSAAVSRADEVVREFGSLDVVTAKMPARAAQALAGRPDVRYVEEDGRAYALAQSVPWGVDRVDADLAHADGYSGSGADIAIIDTGIDSDHPDLQANVGAGADFTGTGSWEDDNGHGTHCAGIANAVNNTEGVVGVSTNATLHAAKVLDSSGGGYWSDIAAAIEWVADQGYDVGSMSLGGSTSNQTLGDACTYAESRGVFLVAAAGNSGPCNNCVGYPAAYPEVMAVSSTNSSDGLSYFSSTGPEIEVAAPGSSIYSTYLGGGYDTLSGTSMACPHVAGAGGQLMANGQSNSQARSTLQNTAEDLGLGSEEQGAGLLDVAAALGSDDGDGGGGGGGGDNAPTVDSLSVNNRSNGGWARFDVDWSVSDQDGDLASVDLTLSQGGATVDSASSGVSGSSASGSNRLQEKKGSGSYDVTVTVTDGNGNTASQTTTVSA